MKKILSSIILILILGSCGNKSSSTQGLGSLDLSGNPTALLQIGAGTSAQQVDVDGTVLTEDWTTGLKKLIDGEPVTVSGYWEHNGQQIEQEYTFGPNDCKIEDLSNEYFYLACTWLPSETGYIISKTTGVVVKTITGIYAGLGGNSVGSLNNFGDYIYYRNCSSGNLIRISIDGTDEVVLGTIPEDQNAIGSGIGTDFAVDRFGNYIYGSYTYTGNTRTQTDTILNGISMGDVYIWTEVNGNIYLDDPYDTPLSPSYYLNSSGTLETLSVELDVNNMGLLENTTILPYGSDSVVATVNGQNLVVLEGSSVVKTIVVTLGGGIISTSGTPVYSIDSQSGGLTKIDIETSSVQVITTDPELIDSSGHKQINDEIFFQKGSGCYKINTTGGITQLSSDYYINSIVGL